MISIDFKAISRINMFFPFLLFFSLLLLTNKSFIEANHFMERVIFFADISLIDMVYF